MKKILILSVGEIQLKSNLSNSAIISFRDKSGIDIVSLQNFSLPKNEQILNHKNILCIEADDVPVVEIKKKSFLKKLFNLEKEVNNNITFFTVDNAVEIINFVEINKDKDIIVQCVYGKSRSLTTAIFIEEYLLKSSHHIEHSERVVRNQSFMDILIRALHQIRIK